MKNLAVLTVLVMCFAVARAALPLVPTEIGTVWEYRTDNAKGKVQGYAVSKVVDVIVSGDTTRVMIEAAALDADRKPLMMPQADGTEAPAVTISPQLIVGDKMVYSSREILDNMPGMPDQVKVKVTGTENTLPFEMTVGEKIPDFATEMTVVMENESGETKELLTMKVAGFDGEVLAREKITTPAGEFDCWKVTQTSTVKMMFMNVTMKSVSWYAPGVGAVRTEQYSGKGKLESVQELTALTPPEAK